MSQTIAMNIRTPQPDLAAITRAAQDANLNDYQLRNAPAKSELEGLQLQSQIGSEKAMAGYREAVGRGDPNALKQLDAQPQMQAQMYAAFDGMSPQEFMEAKKRATAFGKAAQFVGPMIDGTPEQEQRWNASAKVLKDAGMIDEAQFRMMIDGGPSELMIQQAMTTDEWVKAYVGKNAKDDKDPEMKALEIEKIRAEIAKLNRAAPDDETARLKVDLLEAQIAKINAETKGNKSGFEDEAFKSEMEQLGGFIERTMKRARTPEQLAAAEKQIAEKRKEIMDRYGVSNEDAPSALEAPGAADPSVPAGASPSEIPEGATATNPTTGEKIVYEGGQWVPQ
ncbi:MAG: hypothetical protein K8F90_20515 [Hyphomicrobiales bacterium]|nr:hypothetical protein [Hyphomicrobiales bacterium]